MEMSVEIGAEVSVKISVNSNVEKNLEVVVEMNVELSMEMNVEMNVAKKVETGSKLTVETSFTFQINVPSYVSNGYFHWFWCLRLYRCRILTLYPRAHAYPQLMNLLHSCSFLCS